jgi:hypothetical protein
MMPMFLKMKGGLSAPRVGFAGVLRPIAVTTATIPANPTQAETTALLAAMTVQPDAARQTLINNMIFDLKAQGLWATFDLFYVLASHDAQAARINWKTPASVATVNGAPVFTTDRGYAGDGVAAYLGCGVNLSALTNCTQNNSAVGIYVPNNVAIGTGTISLIGNPASIRVAINPRSAADALFTRLMTNSATTSAMTDSRGHSLMTRSSSTGYDRYKNGVIIDSPVVASLATVAEEIQFLRLTTVFSSGQILGLAHYGSSLTPAQIVNFYSIIGTYMTGIGA